MNSLLFKFLGGFKKIPLNKLNGRRVGRVWGV